MKDSALKQRLPRYLKLQYSPSIAEHCAVSRHLVTSLILPSRTSQASDPMSKCATVALRCMPTTAYCVYSLLQLSRFFLSMSFNAPDFWVPEPDGRGTWKIIYSCLTTLTLCVFTALHLNVGPEREPTYRWWMRKLKWVLIGIISPEVCDSESN